MHADAAGLIFNERFEAAARAFPDRPAFRLKTPEGYREVRYREARRRIRGVALGLAAMGLPRGACVAVLSENRLEWVLAYLGSFFAGASAVPLDAQLSPAEWRRLIDDSETRVVFVSGGMLPRLRETLAGSPSPPRLVCMDPVPGEGGAVTELGDFVERALGQDQGRDLPKVGPDDVAVIIYTSGTTGNPKGVVLTHGNIAAELSAILAVVRLDENDVCLGLLPLQHVFSSVITVLTPLSIGAHITFVDTLKRAEILEALEEAGITVVPTVPQFFYLFHKRIQEELEKKPLAIRRLFRLLLLANRFSRRILRVNMGRRLFRSIHRSFGSRMRLFVSGGSPFDPKVAQDFHDLGFTILQGYGLTETTGACSATRPDNNVIGSVGRPLPGMETVIDSPDETGVGEVLIRGPVVMKGYYRKPEATSEVMRGDWFCSGDLGRLDRQGNLFITGRKKEVIVLPSGKNIYPDELETHYLQCPFIQEIAVLGIRDGSGHETSEHLHAVVVPNFDYLKSKKIANTREILRDEVARLSNQLPKYKRVTSYQIQKEPLPRTTTRKIKRLELKRLIESGELRGMEPAGGGADERPEDAALRNTAIGREVLRCLREDYRRDGAITFGMNLELDLGFDSMERVELLASLEQSLDLKLTDGFGAEIFTVRDLVSGLEREAGSASTAKGAVRQSWSTILSPESLAADAELNVSFAGTALSLFGYVCLRMFYVLFRIFLRLEARGLENLPKSGAYLICPNHLSHFDPFVVVAVLPYRALKRVFFVGASEYFVSWHMKLLASLTNVTPVDPDANLLRAMKVGAYGLRQGRILCIFPEGARSFDGELKEFKKGAAILSAELSSPIVPVGIRGTHEVWPRDSMRIRPHKVTLVFGNPMQAEVGDANAPYQQDTDRLRDKVASLVRP